MRRFEKNTSKSGSTQSEEMSVSDYESAFVVVKLDGSRSSDTATLDIYGAASDTNPIYGAMISSAAMRHDIPIANSIDVRGVAKLKIEVTSVTGGSVYFQVGTFGTKRFGT